MHDQHDLIVVGTGFASTFFLYQYLSKASKNRKILVLERGHLFSGEERRKDLAGQDTPSSKLNPNPHETYVNNNPEKHWAFSLGFGGSSCWLGSNEFGEKAFSMGTWFKL